VRHTCGAVAARRPHSTISSAAYDHVRKMYSQSVAVCRCTVEADDRIVGIARPDGCALSQCVLVSPAWCHVQFRIPRNQVRAVWLLSLSPDKTDPAVSFNIRHNTTISKSHSRRLCKMSLLVA
jgi:hypothetical protein